MIQFPEPKSLDVLEIGSKSHERNFQKYDVSNPHPGYGKDSNIINEYGHTLYPKWIDGPNGRVVVNNAEEEAKETGAEVKQPTLPKNDPWTA